MAGIPPIDVTALTSAAMRPEATTPSIAKPETGAVPFENLLKNMVDSANQASLQADASAQAFVSGSVDDIHGTMIAMKKADIELKVAANVRNKVMDAFYELWRMNL